MKKLLLLFVLFAALCSQAATVDTVSISSDAMRRAYKCIVVKPDSYLKGKETYPVVYLLHGLGGRYSDWVTKTNLKICADRYNLIVVCPDGANSSWYVDSPVDSTMRFETYISKEIPDWVDANYRTTKTAKARAITGLSMGGHGGLFLGFRHPDEFGAMGSMSGALAVELITDPHYGVNRLLGDSTNKALFRSYSIFGELDKKPQTKQPIIVDCGTEDFIVEMSRLVHKRLLELKIPHDYTERPGKHDWEYWNNAIQYQLLFFRNYFDRKD
jgi:S-formylglutathione hydrolase FrmB